MIFNYSKSFILSQIPRNYIKINERAFSIDLRKTPYSYSIYTKILLNYNEHLKNKNIDKKNIISINTIAEYSGMFTIKEKQGKEFRFTRHFIEVMENNLKALEESKLIKYEYITNNRNSYEEYLKNNIKIEWLEKPDIKTFINKNKNLLTNKQ